MSASSSLTVLTLAAVVGTPLAVSGQPLSFSTARHYDAGSERIVGMAAGDLDGDGGPDLVLTGSDGSTLMMHTFLSAADGTLRTGGTLTLPSGRGHVTLGDFTGDGRLDAVIDAAGIRLLPGLGNGTFGSAIVSPGYAWEVISADFNGDGRLDLASGGDNTTAGPPETIDVYLGNGNGTFGTFRTVLLSDNNPGGLSSGDLNGDGRQDLVLGWRNSRQLQVFLNDGNGTFTSAGLAFSEVGPSHTAVGDLDRDGRADVVTANSVPSVSAFRGNGNGTLQAGQTYPVTDCGGTSCPAPRWLVLRDMDGDGAPDVITANGTPGSASVLFNNGAGVLESALVLPARQYAYTVAAADFNRDGKADVAVTSSDVAPNTSGARVLSVHLQSSGGSTGNLQPVSWTNLVNATAEGGRLRKTGGCNGCFDAGAIAAQAIEAGAAAVEFTIVDTAMRLVAGLATGPVHTSADIAFGLQQQGHPFLEVRENGVYRRDIRVAAGDVLRIDVTSDGTVRYARNGSVFYTSARRADWPLTFMALLATAGATLGNGRIQAGAAPPPPPPPPDGETGWSGESHVTVVDGTITKTSGCDGCFDAAAVSDGELASGNGWLEFTVVDPTAILAVGLTGAFVGTSPGQLAFSIRIQGSGWAEVRESGLYASDVRAAAGDVFRISVSDGLVTYSRNGAAFHTSHSGGLAPLIGAAAFADLGASIDAVVLRAF